MSPAVAPQGTTLSAVSPRKSRLLRSFLWGSVTGWGIGLGAKLFDLLVVATAWGQAPPGSLSLMPYGKAYPISPGDFFQPLSVLLLVGSAGALWAGWHAPRSCRSRLLVPVMMLLVIWMLTPTLFWPMLNDLWAASQGRLALGNDEVVALTQRWFVWDSVRTLLIFLGFVFTVQAMGADACRAERPSTGETRC